jgi:hypothetical protein
VACQPQGVAGGGGFWCASLALSIGRGRVEDVGLDREETEDDENLLR